MFAEALRVTLALILFRGGPQDMPYSLPLTRAAALIAALTASLLMSPMLPVPMTAATAVGGVAGITFFTLQLLRMRRLQNRFAQTLAAQLWVGSVFALAMTPAMNALAPATLALLKDPQAMDKLRQGVAPDIAAPGWATLLSDLLFFWNVAVSVRINRLAADLNGPLSLLLTLASLFVLMSFIVLAQLLVLSFS